MNRVIGTLMVIGGLGFLGLGAIFLIAGGDSALTGGLLVAIGLVLFLAVYLMARVDAKRPTNITQNIQMSGSGEFRERAIQCPGCGGSVADKDIKLIDGGLMLNCPFCGKVSALEEEPKW